LPAGTLVKDHDSGEIIHDFTRPGEKLCVAEGGRGGRGNARFATSTNRAPRRHELGRQGGVRRLDLELKLIADVGLVGFPNAGKSTLISRISSARPKIGDYPFTTVEPHLGVVEYEEGKTFVVADIPGLIEGAHKGTGLGLEFLRHIERTKVLLHLVDVSSASGRDPVSDYQIIDSELKLYSASLLEKPRMVVASKMDALDDPARLERLRLFCREQNIELAEISAVTGQGIGSLVSRLWSWLEKLKPDAESAAAGN
jgi:GTP-binding protein